MGYKPRARMALDRSGNPPIYRIGEQMKIGLKPEEDVYVYLLCNRADKQIDLLFPENGNGRNLAKKDSTFFVPPDKGKGLEVKGPEGLAQLWVVGLRSPLETDGLSRPDMVKKLLAEGVMTKATVYMAG